MTGFNAAGKSTSIQPLLLLAQATRKGMASVSVPLNGNLVRLGSGAEVLARKSLDREISLSLEDAESMVEWSLGVSDVAGSNTLHVKRVTIEDGGGHVASFESLGIWPKGAQDSFVGDKIIEAVRNVIYISADRSGTAEVRPMPDDDAVYGDVGENGQFAASWYANHVDDEVDENRRYPDEFGVTLRRQVDAYLADICPGGNVNADVIPRTSLTRLAFRTSDQSDWLRPANVGYGLSYVFPVLVAGLIARPNQILIIDSPEAHLHPRAQSKIGGFLAKMAGAGVQILVETHSDHVLNGARLAVRHGVIEPNALSIHFFEGVQSDAHGVKSPSVDRSGSLDYWPLGFFDQTEFDLAVLSGIIK